MDYNEILCLKADLLLNSLSEEDKNKFEKGLIHLINFEHERFMPLGSASRLYFRIGNEDVLIPIKLEEFKV